MVSVFESPPLSACPTPFNMADYVLAAGAERPEKTALELRGLGTVETFSYADIRTKVQGLAATMIAHGVTPGDRVLMRLGNELAFPICYLAALWIGAVPVPTSALLTEAEINKISDLLVPNLIVAGTGVALPTQTRCPIFMLDEDIPSSSSRPIPPHFCDPDRPGYIIFTSGTTQGPRGVLHAHRAIWARQMMFDHWYGLKGDDRLMHAGAFNWTYTLGTGLMDPWTVGATAIIPKPEVRSTDLFDVMDSAGASIFAAAPGVYRQLLRSERAREIPTLRHGLSAGEKLASAIKQSWRDVTGTDVHEALGMSECSTFISGSPGKPAHDGHAGWPQPGRKIAVLDDEGEPVTYGTPGILAIHRSDPGLCLGYLDAPLPDGDYFLTGDTVSLSADGEITYLGRGDDMLNAGGVRVSPIEVEACFATCPGVRESAAIALSPKPNTEVIALVYGSSKPIDEESLRAHAQSMLARYKQPRLYIHRLFLPKGANGKLSRKSLRAEIEGTS